MSEEEVKKLFRRIKGTYDMFSEKNKDKFTEWYKILKDYSNEGVNRNFDTYLKEGNTEPPIASQLINEFIRVDRTKPTDGQVTCCTCGKFINYPDVEHEDRCRSINYIKRMTAKYFLDKMPDLNNKLKELYDMNQNDFDNFYNHFLESIKKKGETVITCLEDLTSVLKKIR